jgi:hypothetical protein
MKPLAPLLALLLAPAAQADPPRWSEIRSAGWTHHATRKNDVVGTVEVYAKVVAGVECFQGVTTTRYTPQQLFEVAADIEGAMQWSTAGVTDAKTLARTDTVLDYYQFLDIPGWTMAADRYWFLHGTIERSGGAIVFRWDRIVDGGAYAAFHQQVRAAHPDALEIPVNVGAWVFTPKDGATQLQYYVCSDTGGHVPTAVQGVATTRTLPDNLADVVREAGKRNP